MPMYEFKSSDGDVIERFYPVSRAPRLGYRVKQNGKVYRRVISFGQIRPDIKPFASYALPKKTPGFQHDAKGRPVVESRQQRDEYAKRLGYEWASTTDF